MRLRTIALTVVSMFWVFPSILQGAWSSGGGEILQDANNPWFLQNTKDVTYCILVDRDNFHADADAIGRAVTNAIDFWKHEFKNAPSGSMNGVAIRVATQSFKEETECSDNIDITFQMGYLTGEQIEYLGDPTRFISVAVRTNYDRVNLKGKGFIYLAADSGPLKPNRDHLADRPWAIGKGGLMEKVLIHELGHVFGLPHRTSNLAILSGSSAMAAGFPESLLQKEHAAGWEAMKMPSFFNLDEDFQYNQGCMKVPADVPYKFFGAAKDHCIEVIYKGGAVEVYAGEIGEPKSLIGTATMESGENTMVESAFEVWMPDEQKVFELPKDYPVRYVGGIYFKTPERKGTYRSVDGKIERTIFMTIPLNEIIGIRVGGIMNDKIYLNVFHGF